MKSLITAAAAVAVLAAVPAAVQAQPIGSEVYGSVGYAQSRSDGLDLGAIQGRAGVKINEYFGVEGELALGVKDDSFRVGGADVDVELEHSAAIYGVGFLPINPNADLFARVGYGTTEVKASAGGVSAKADGESWNFGVGGRYFMDAQNGVRVDYTRQEFQDDGGAADVWSLGYVRKF
ncbi:porin family protein [Phenylobacterium sp.]|uniref:porin family protein n=1 Tax=Phenylobacterium sp. TaxID=1871053 RepID=UPI00273205B0|nr:porin family protein [Phenylobacterium sp.]MDP1875706.1 porin family protein [Phenylobacterium sp.]MDP3491414.1 porin family protein [Phenylobacterium sp.]